MQHSLSEENYLKSIFKLLETGRDKVSTNDLGRLLNTKAPSVTDMLKKLHKKGLIEYTPYYGVSFTEKGLEKAREIVRKHRLWETFMVEVLKMPCETVHEVAEQLEHVHSKELIDAIDAFLNYPDTDPHGREIPAKTEIQ